MPREIKLIKNRSDIGAGTRGSDLGIDAIEVAAINRESFFFNHFAYEDLRTHNETVYDKVHTTFAKRIGHVLEQCVRVCESVHRSLSNGFFPLVLSGDHSSALGTVSGIKAQFPEQILGIVWIDAHADLHSPYTSPSGNVHGMPLAAALGEDNRENQVNPVSGDTLLHWMAMKNMGVIGPKLMPTHLLYFGVRDTEPAEQLKMEALGIRNYTVEEIRYRGVSVCMDEAVSTLERCDMLYISFDVDSLDCNMISHGTGTPVPKGFDQYEVMSIIDGVIKTGKVVCMEIAEVNPLLDTRGNKMAETAFEVLEGTVASLQSRDELVGRL